MKILVMGLPGAGKTTLVTALAPLLGAIHFNGDDVRQLYNDTDFSIEGRVRQARRMGALCNAAVRAGQTAIADFVCPTEACREVFGADHIIWVDTVKPADCRFPDTAAMFEPPKYWKHHVIGDHAPERVQIIADSLADDGNTAFDWLKPTALFVGRFQPFHDGHMALVREGIERIGQACIAVRARPISGNDPYTFEAVRLRIRARMAESGLFLRQYAVTRLPNITGFFYGRDVGYQINRIDLPQATEAIRGRDLRERQQR